MYELIQLTERDYYINAPTRVGVVLVGENEAVLVDSGSDADAGKKALRHLTANGWNLRAIYCTHSHADHIGGNRFLQDRTGCKIYARGMEAVYTAHPELEGISLYGGNPYPDLRSKFFLAKASDVLPLTENDLPEGWRLWELPGHSLDHTGFLTPDGTSFIGDSVSSAETVAKYGIIFHFDPDTSLLTMEKLKTAEAARFVPSHAPVTEEIAPLCEANLQGILTMRERIRSFLTAPLTFDELLKRVFDAYGMVMNGVQWPLIGSSVRSCLSGMLSRGEVACRFEDNLMRWENVSGATAAE